MNTSTSKQVKRFERFIKDYNAFLKELGEGNEFEALAEDADTFYRIKDVNILIYQVNLTIEYRNYFRDTYHEIIKDEYDLEEWIDKWRKDLRRAKRYWSMDLDTLEAIQNGDIEDVEAGE